MVLGAAETQSHSWPWLLRKDQSHLQHSMTNSLHEKLDEYSKIIFCLFVLNLTWVSANIQDFDVLEEIGMQGKNASILLSWIFDP